VQEVDQTARADDYVDESADDTSGDRSVPTWRYQLVAVKHHRGVYRFACSLLKDGAEAEDVTQEAFLRYWQQGRDVQKPKEWLFKVVYNACMDRLRKAGRFVALNPDGFDEPTDHRDPAWHYGQRELAAELKRLVATLPEPQRSLILLFDVQGLSGDECAAVLGINRNQVKVYLHRARRRLRSKLEQTR
jgi:RNA polymerase sigma-70 factor (ECF subfamily)